MKGAVAAWAELYSDLHELMFSTKHENAVLLLLVFAVGLTVR